MFDLPPGADRTVQYADYLGSFDPAPVRDARGDRQPRTSFLLVTIPTEVARGVVARSVAALSKRGNHVLGYVENMSGYYCRDCGAIRPLFTAAASDGFSSPRLEIPCLGTVPFDPFLARLCDSGLALPELPDTPVGLAIEHVARALVERLDPTTTGPEGSR
jgi:hypothetical protein